MQAKTLSIGRIPAGCFSGLSGGTSAAILGDSFSARNTSLYYRTTDYGYFNWANALLGCPFSLVLNAGVAGNTTSQILARISSVLEVKPAWCFVLGGINDIAQGVPIQTTIENLKTICTKLQKSGIRTVLIAVSPNTQSAGQSRKVQQVNQEMARWCEAGQDGVIFVDAYKYVVNPTDTTGAAQDGMLHDALHPSAKGARAIGRAIADTIKNLVPSVSILPSTASNSYAIDATSSQLLANPLFTGSAGVVIGAGASGTLATGWSGGTASGTLTSVFSSGQSRADGIGFDQRIAITNAAANSSVNIRQSPSLSAMSVGDYIHACAAVSLSGMIGVSSVYLQVQITDGEGTKFIMAMEPQSTTYDNADCSVVLKTPEFAVTSTLTSCTFALIVKFGESNGSATVYVGRAGLFKRALSA